MLVFPLGELRGAFNALTIQEKLVYSASHPNNNLCSEAENQEMLEIQRKYAYILPFEVINGKQNIFSIDPQLSLLVESEKLKVYVITSPK